MKIIMALTIMCTLASTVQAMNRPELNQQIAKIKQNQICARNQFNRLVSQFQLLNPNEQPKYFVLTDEMRLDFVIIRNHLKACENMLSATEKDLRSRHVDQE